MILYFPTNFPLLYEAFNDILVFNFLKRYFVIKHLKWQTSLTRHYNKKGKFIIKFWNHFTLKNSFWNAFLWWRGHRLNELRLFLRPFNTTFKVSYFHIYIFNCRLFNAREANCRKQERPVYLNTILFQNKCRLSVSSAPSCSAPCEQCTILQCTILQCTILQCTILQCTIMQCTILYIFKALMIGMGYFVLLHFSLNFSLKNTLSS